MTEAQAIRRRLLRKVTDPKRWARVRAGNWAIRYGVKLDAGEPVQHMIAYYRAVEEHLMQTDNEAVLVAAHQRGRTLGAQHSKAGYGWPWSKAWAVQQSRFLYNDPEQREAFVAGHRGEWKRTEKARGTA